MLRRLLDQNRKFDLIILDPPKFAPTAAFAAKAAADTKISTYSLSNYSSPVEYWPLATYSCYSAISNGLFQKIVAGAALDANVNAHILAQQMAAPDHPILLSFPEGAYLKELLLSSSRLIP